MKRLSCFLLLFVIITTSLYAQTNYETTDSIPKETLFGKVEKWYKENTNYYTITALMAVESTFVPFPSEIIIPPAAYIASDPESDLNIVLIVIFGTLGAILGATINYALSIWLGRKIIYKFANSKIGHLFFLSSEKIKHAEDYFNRNGKTSTFIGRLIPGIRHLVSIPAGLAKMNYPNFVIYTALGACIWNIILALLGYLAHGQKELIDQYSGEISNILLILGGVFIVYLIFKAIKKKNIKK